jgi:DNA-binding NarL/FixJ family response regulator
MKVLLIDDHPLILSALQTVIRGIGDDVTVVGVDTAAGARKTLADDADFDLVLLDLGLPDADGFDLLTELRGAYPGLPVVVLSASERTSDVIRAIDSGAMGFVSKRNSTAILYDALTTVMQGGLYIPKQMLGLEGPTDAESDTVPAVMRHAAESGIKPEPHQQAVTLDKIGLTPRQTDVLALLLQGKPNKLIARELNLSVETVKDHVAAVLRALNVNTRTQAVLAVSQMTRDGGTTWWRRGP